MQAVPANTCLQCQKTHAGLAHAQTCFKLYVFTRTQSLLHVGTNPVCQDASWSDTQQGERLWPLLQETTGNIIPFYQSKQYLFQKAWNSAKLMSPHCPCRASPGGSAALWAPASRVGQITPYCADDPCDSTIQQNKRLSDSVIWRFCNS